jgi:hypothetical protein
MSVYTESSQTTSINDCLRFYAGCTAARYVRHIIHVVRRAIVYMQVDFEDQYARISPHVMQDVTFHVHVCSFGANTIGSREYSSVRMLDVPCPYHLWAWL